MTIERITLSETHLKIAFSSKERPYIIALTNRCNYLLGLVLEDLATMEEKLEYYSLKWAIKELGGVEKEGLERAKRIL